MHVPQATATGSNRADRANQGVRAPFEELFEGVDDLIKRVADTENPEIRKIRAKVHASMVVARSAFEGRASHLPRSAPPPGDSEAYPVEDPDQGEDPDQALGVALLVGVGLGVMMSMQP